MGRNSFRVSAILAAATAMLFTSPAVADDDLTFSPSSDWRFREYDDRCRASRNFGEGEDRTSLWIEQGGAEANYNVTLIGRPLRHPYGPAVRLQFGDQPEIIRSFLTAESSRGRPVLMMYGVSLIQPDEMELEQDAQAPEAEFNILRADAITTLRLSNSIVEPFMLELGPMTEPLGFLGLCGAKLAGILSEAGRPLTGEATAPVPIDPDTWLMASDYPDYLLRARMQGRLLVRITVGKSGKPTSCFVTQSNKPQLFDDTVCLGLMRRARFEPARNAQGEPVASYYPYAISFEIEE